MGTFPPSPAPCQHPSFYSLVFDQSKKDVYVLNQVNVNSHQIHRGKIFSQSNFTKNEDSQRTKYTYCCLVAKSYPTLCTPMDCSPPGSTVHGILQARLPEWVVISSSRASSQPRDQTHIFCIGRWILFLPLSNLEAPLYIVLVPNDLCSFTTTHGILWHYHRICPDVHGSVLLQGRLKCVCVGLP